MSRTERKFGVYDEIILRINNKDRNILSRDEIIKFSRLDHFSNRVDLLAFMDFYGDHILANAEWCASIAGSMLTVVYWDDDPIYKKRFDEVWRKLIGHIEHKSDCISGDDLDIIFNSIMIGIESKMDIGPILTHLTDVADANPICSLSRTNIEDLWSVISNHSQALEDLCQIENYSDQAERINRFIDDVTAAKHGLRD